MKEGKKSLITINELKKAGINILNYVQHAIWKWSPAKMRGFHVFQVVPR